MAEEIKRNGQMQETLSNGLILKYYFISAYSIHCLRCWGHKNKTGQYLCPILRMMDNIESKFLGFASNNWVDGGFLS